jgi:3-methyladenine DNA glycosylase Mpg
MVLGQPDAIENSKIWIEKGTSPISAAEITTGTRIGVDYAEEDALRLYRFTWKT